MRSSGLGQGFVIVGVGLGLSGCGLLETVEPYTNTLSTQSVFIGVVNPLKGTIPVEDQLVMSVFVADAADIGDIEEAPVTGAEVRVAQGQADGALTEVEGGLYYGISTGEEGAIRYQDGNTYAVEVVANDESFESSGVAPGAAAFEEDRTCVTAAQATSLHVTGGTYERLVVAVYDDSGAETWSNIPRDASQLVDFITADVSSGVIEVPGEAFPDAETAYGVAVIGLVQEGTYSDNLNPLLSHFYVGAGRVGLIGTFTTNEPCEALSLETGEE